VHDLLPTPPHRSGAEALASGSASIAFPHRKRTSRCDAPEHSRARLFRRELADAERLFLYVPQQRQATANKDAGIPLRRINLYRRISWTAFAPASVGCRLAVSTTIFHVATEFGSL